VLWLWTSQGGLRDVRIAVTMGEEVTACRHEPAGEWLQPKRTLTWKLEAVVPDAPTYARVRPIAARTPRVGTNDHDSSARMSCHVMVCERSAHDARHSSPSAPCAHAVSRRPLKAEFVTGGASREGRTGRPLSVAFASDTCTLTKLQPRPASGGPVGKVLQRFVSGKYVVNP
jgi:hypothetical protein